MDHRTASQAARPPGLDLGVASERGDRLGSPKTVWDLGEGPGAGWVDTEQSRSSCGWSWWWWQAG